MPSPDPVAPERLEALLGGAVPEGRDEARLQGLARELRVGGASAPPRLHERVARLGETPPRRRPAPSRRRLLPLALVSGLLGVAGAGLALAVQGGDTEAAEIDAGVTETAPAAETSVGREAREGAFRARPPSPEGQVAERTVLDRDAGGGRAIDVDLFVELRLRDADELSAAAGEAVAAAREVGGWVAGTDVDTHGREGEARLELRVPVARVEDVVVRLGELGTVTGQRMETVDLQAAIDRRQRRIERLERAIRIAGLRLGSATLTPEERLRLELRLERHRAERADLRRANAGDRRDAAVAELTVLLHTREAPAAADEDESGAAGAAGDALRFLAGAAAVAVFALIVAAPPALLALVIWIALRSRSRRIETRLLDRRPEPAGPPSK
ncbi:MAG TPA: DUF4349 domain-containing protein [Gaiellaceae bacterium]|nr:DUF4349 domain-containing protein [Gaiellaceae bacterium]